MPSLQISYALAFLGLLALLSPAAEARRLHQDSSMSTITDADILNFALNLEVRNQMCKFILFFHLEKMTHHELVQ